MQKDLMIVDDFYAQPDRVREFALNVSDWIDTDVAGNKKPSRESRKCYYNNDVVQQFEGLLRMPIHVDPARMGFGVFAYYPEGSGVEQTTHFDDTEWTGVAYLIPNELCQGGLTLYRHKETGLTGPPDEAALRRLGVESLEQWLEDVYHPDKKNPDAWERTMHIAMRFNRLVLFQAGKMFHRASSGFGSDPQNGRLTQRFFFESRAQ